MKKIVRKKEASERKDIKCKIEKEKKPLRKDNEGKMR